jgi:hypothetical protein
MPQAHTILEQVEANFITGQTFIQWRKQIVAANGAIVFAEPHRTSLDPAHYAPDGKTLIPATDLPTQIAAVSAHLISMGWPAVAATDTAAIQPLDANRLTLVPAVPIAGTPLTGL